MKKILVVEDEKNLAKILEVKLEKEGYKVFVAQNGQEGFDQALLHHPDLILLDIIMPVMDGMTMLRQLREDDWGKKVPVILLTNLNDSESIAEASKKGVYDYLVKADWKLEDIVEIIDKKLK